MQPSSHLPSTPHSQPDCLPHSPGPIFAKPQQQQQQQQKHQELHHSKPRQLRPHHLLQLFQLYPLSFNLLRSLLSSVSSIREQDCPQKTHTSPSGVQSCSKELQQEQLLKYPQFKEQESNPLCQQELVSTQEQTMQAQTMSSMDTILSEMNRILAADPSFHFREEEEEEEGETEATTSHWHMGSLQQQQQQQQKLPQPGSTASSTVMVTSTTPHSPLLKNTDHCTSSDNDNNNLAVTRQKVAGDSTLFMETSTVSGDSQQASVTARPSSHQATPPPFHPATAFAQNTQNTRGNSPAERYSQGLPQQPQQSSLQRPSHSSGFGNDSILDGDDATPPSWLWDAYRLIALSAVDTILSRNQDHQQLQQDRQEDQRQQKQQFSNTDAPMEGLFEHPQFHHLQKLQQQQKQQSRETGEPSIQQKQGPSGEAMHSPPLEEMEGIECEGKLPLDSGRGSNSGSNNNIKGVTNIWYDPTLDLATKALTALSTLYSTGIESLMVDNAPSAPSMARRASSPNCSAGSMGTVSQQFWTSSTGPIRRWSSNKNPQLYSNPSSASSNIISGVTPLSALSSPPSMAPGGSTLGPLFGTVNAAGSTPMGVYPFLAQHHQARGKSTAGLFWEQEQRQECDGINRGPPYSLEIDMMGTDRAAGARATAATTIVTTGAGGGRANAALGSTDPMALADNSTDLTALLSENDIACLGIAASDVRISPSQAQPTVSGSPSPTASPSPSPTLSYNFGGGSSATSSVSMMALDSTSPLLGTHGMHGNSPHHHPHSLNYHSHLYPHIPHSAMLAATMAVAATSSHSKSLVPPILPCPVANCPKTFARIYNLNSHIKTHHQQQAGSDETIPGSSPPSLHALVFASTPAVATSPTVAAAAATVATGATATSPKSFSCHLCPRIFSRKHDLQRHIRVHTGSKPYLCLNCQKAFARTDALCRHYKVEDACRRVVVELEADEEIRKMQQTQVQQQLQMEMRDMQLAQKQQQQRLLVIQQHQQQQHQQYRQAIGQVQIPSQDLGLNGQGGGGGGGERGGGQGVYQGQNQGHFCLPSQQTQEQLAFRMAMSNFP